MKSECCKNCFYLTSKNSKDFPLSDYHIEYACEFHKLYRREVSHPDEQRCNDWTSIKSGVRNLKLEELGIK
jgi:hypothetical protein